MTNFGKQLQNYAQDNSDKCLHPIRWVDSDNLCHKCNQYVPTLEAIDTQAARIATIEAENARLTAANESMQEDAVQNTYAFELMLKANKEQAEEIRTQEDEIGRLRHLLYTHNIEWEIK